MALAQSGFEYELIVVDYETSAQSSPNARVPYFTDADLMLTDSSSILKYIREKSGRGFMLDLDDYDRFIVANTALDTELNLALMSKEGFGPEQINYLQRQKNRVRSGLAALNSRIDPNEGLGTDSALRCACFLGWALFRKRFDLEAFANLKNFMLSANQDALFVETTPFE